MRKLENTNIYIGSLKDAQDERALRKAKIKVIMNVCSDIDTPHYHDITLVKWGLDDPRETLTPRNAMHEVFTVFDLAVGLAKRRDGNILIHCHAGNNRSALVAALWLRRSKGIRLKKAAKLAKVKDKKPWMIDLGYSW